MAYTLQQLVDYARIPLNDAKLTPAGAVRTPRYSDADMLEHAKHGLFMLRRDRSDLFIGNFSGAGLVDLSALVLGSTFPIVDDYMEPVADYVSARAQIKDGEEVTDAKAPLFFALFTSGKGNK